MSFGLTDDGLLIPTQAEIRQRLDDAVHATFGASIDTGDKSIFGQFNGILAEQLHKLWEQLEAVNASQNPDKATLAQLDAICTLTGTFRPAASFSTVTLTLTGTPTTLIAAGSKAKTESTEKNFATIANATTVATDAWVALTAYVVGDRVTNASNVYYCSTAGTSAGSGGPVQTDRDPVSVADGSAAWVWLGAGTSDIDVIALAEVTGVVTGVAYDINQIETAVFGWDGVVNLLDATEGRDEAKDGELRLLREQELSQGGNGTIDALRAEVLTVEGVTAATVFVNNTDTTDSDGVPAHSVEVMVRGGDDQEIWDALLAGVAAGVNTYGGEIGTSTDDEGTVHVMAFSRPDEINIYVGVTLTYDEDEYPEDGDDQVIAAIVAFGDRQITGKNVVASSLVAQVFTIAGVLDASVLMRISFPPIASTTITINLRELAVFDTSRVTVSSSSAVP